MTMVGQSKSTLKYAEKFKKLYPNIGDIYGINILQNLHKWHYYIYEQNIDEINVLTR